MPTVIKKVDAGAYQLKDQVVSINRVTKVVKGGKNLSFAALVVVGDPSSAVVGFGSGKAKEVPQAIRKGIESAKKNLMRVNLTQTTIPHTVLGRFGSGMVLLKPAPEGTGVIAGGAVRAVMTSVGNPERADQIDRHHQSAQRGESHLRRAEETEEPGSGGGGARQDCARVIAKYALRKRGGMEIEDCDDGKGGEQSWKRQAAPEVGAIGDLRSGEAETGGEGPGIYPAESGDRASG